MKRVNQQNDLPSHPIIAFTHGHAKHGCRRGVQRFMTRWTVFDTHTASVVASHLPAGGSLQVAAGDPLAAALSAEDPVTYALLPSGQNGELILARIERKKQTDADLRSAPSIAACEASTQDIAEPAPEQAPEAAQDIPGTAEENKNEEAPELDLSPPSTEDEPMRYEAGGFLGLSDEPVFPTDYRSPKKWWERLLK